MSESFTTWQSWFCLGQGCAPREWLVQHDAHHAWTIVEEMGALYTVASNVPICPCCGDTLHPVSAVETPHSRGRSKT